MVCDLTNKKCKPCEGGVDAYTREQADTQLKQLAEGWALNKEATAIVKSFKFKGYYKTIAFVNAVAWIANREIHHPDLQVSYNECIITYQTHAINGLSENDFICAAKIDALG